MLVIDRIMLHEKLMRAQRVGASNDQQFFNILKNLYQDDQTIPTQEKLEEETKDPIFGREIEVFSHIFYATEQEYENLEHHDAFATAVTLCDWRFKAQGFHESLVQLVYLPYFETETLTSNNIINFVKHNRSLGSLFEYVRMLPVPSIFYGEIDAFLQLKLGKWSNADAEIILDNLLEQIDKVEKFLVEEKKEKGED